MTDVQLGILIWFGLGYVGYDLHMRVFRNKFPKTFSHIIPLADDNPRLLEVVALVICILLGPYSAIRSAQKTWNSWGKTDEQLLAIFIEREKKK